ncbi:hypothetical protein [Actinomadura sp. DC4]|uniref:hypothetical protein n=1 Tax=Actinomadura sp. DC4 TaxID=3055069 RepID=UPI0025B1AA70|nr:hypothetical protein [Actinomadura sp. DC4]MDN3354206.1 hypothetical protein [Actinomadura sp. DC4]
MIGMRSSDNLTGHRLSVRRTVLEHLRHRGIIGVDDRRVTGGSPLALGVSGITADSGGVVAIDGDRCVPSHRTLSDVLGTGGYLADRMAVAARHEAGYDPVLYHAIRDFLPPREKASKRCVPAGTPEHAAAESRDHIFADLVVYQPGTLPGGEPFRSTGHWNLPGQLEIFQTLTGRVAMLVGGYTRDGRPFLYEQVCGPGDLMAVPFGIWHVTYVLDGPAVVFNLTTEVGDAGSVVAHPGEEKYHRASPIAVTACRDSGRHSYVGEGLDLWGRPLGAPRTDWLQSLLAPGESLADLHLYASPSRLAALQRLAWEAYGRCWPHHGGLLEPA